MFGVVIVAHGHLAQAYLAAIEHFLGEKQDGVRAVTVQGDCDRDAKSKKYVKR